MIKKMPSEAVQISAQIFAKELASFVSKERGIPIREALALSVKGTRECLENTGMIDRDELDALPPPPKEQPHD